MANHAVLYLGIHKEIRLTTISYPTFDEKDDVFKLVPHIDLLVIDPKGNASVTLTIPQAARLMYELEWLVEGTAEG